MRFLQTISQTGNSKSFAQRLRYTAIWWGIPMLLLELVGVPWRMWIFMVLIALPATALGVLCAAALQHFVFSRKRS